MYKSYKILNSVKIFFICTQITYVFLFSACSLLPTTSNLDKDYVAKSSDALIVIGVNERYRIMFSPGTYDSEISKIGQFLVAPLHLFPENGYIIAKLPPLNEGEAYAISQVMPRGILARYSVDGGVFVPCDNISTLSFNTIKGQIIYLGDVIFNRKEGYLSMSFDSNVEKARQFLKTEYPSYTDKLKVGKTKVLPTTFRCKLIVKY